jgi:hypothetical protein
MGVKVKVPKGKQMTTRDEMQLAMKIRTMYSSRELLEREHREFIRANQCAFFTEVGEKVRGTIERINAALRSDGIESTFSQDSAHAFRIATCLRFDAKASLELKPSEASVIFGLKLLGKPKVADIWKFDAEPGPRLVLGQSRVANTAVKFSTPEEVGDFVIKSVFGE